MPLRLLLLFCFFAFSAPCVQAQQAKADSLKRVLRAYERRQAAQGMKTPVAADTVKAKLFYRIAGAMFDVKPDSALPYIRRFETLSKATGFYEGMGNACMQYGLYYDLKGDYRRAIPYYQKAIALFLKHKVKRGLEEGYINLSVAYANLNSFDEAIRYSLEALSRAKAKNNHYLVATLYNNIGLFCKRLDRDADALRYYRLCLSHADKAKDDRIAAIVNRNIANILLEQGRPDEAMPYLERGLAHAEKGGYKEAKALNYETFARVSAEKGDKKAALDYHKKALALRRETGDEHGIAQSTLSVGQSLAEVGAIHEALEYLHAGLDMAIAGQDLEIQCDGYQGLTKAYAARGDYKKAYFYFGKLDRAKDSMNTLHNKTSFDNLRMRYDVKSVQDSLGAIQLKKDVVAKEAVKRQKDTRNFIAIGAALVVIFLVIVLIQRAKIARIRREKALEEERNRINRDLHDTLGAQLSTVRMYMSGLHGEGKVESGTAIGLLDDSIHELRRIMNDEESALLKEEGLIAAVAGLATKIQNVHGIRFELNHNLDGRQAERTEHQLYRILQELINNSLKYAQAGTISIDFTLRDQRLVLFYEDDGAGFDPETAAKGNGLANIAYRVGSLGGTVEFDSKPGYGARTVIEIPVT